ncbi:hypothetical protein K1T71_001685 [Dendrolimus kikuchii]|uniref:Uncharacterized protein n=1 Tax=Dendrolimus kikuchii TaxID=765133 RepID=A0ACC1DES5_9NEOP|nr:hypothetical protein K1T71_001685 [Dendrolimus kikuchii]
MSANQVLLPGSAMYKSEMKDVKDMSKNLMSGDFENQYKGAMEKCGKKRYACIITLSVIVIVLGIVLVAMSVIQVKLRHDVDMLSANMIAMSANLELLNQKMVNKYNDFKTIDNTIYTDEDQDMIHLDSSDKEETEFEQNKTSYDSLEKLREVTVNLGDDEDMNEPGNEEESGDWYPDYDTEKFDAGTLRLIGDSMTDSVLVFDKKEEANIGTIKKMLNENPENPEILSMNSEQLKTSTEETSGERTKRSISAALVATLIGESDNPTNLFNEKDTKRQSPSSLNATPSGNMKVHKVSRTTRNSDYDDSGARRPFIAAHFHGNTSHLSTKIHEHYKGNGLVRVSHGSPHDVWYPSPWTLASPHPRPTLTSNGHIHVHHTGVYLVYVQIYYLDSHDVISWVLHRTNPEIEGKETLLQCAQSSHSAESMDKPNSCFSASALFLKAGDRLAVRNTGGDRHSLMQPEKSFIGLIKLADAEDPTPEL